MTVQRVKNDNPERIAIKRVFLSWFICYNSIKLYFKVELWELVATLFILDFYLFYRLLKQLEFLTWLCPPW